MSSLTQVSITSRRIIRFSIYAVALFIIARFSVIIGTKIYRMFVPEPPPPPTLTFGVLPELPFPYDTPYPENLILNLETPSGDLPKLAPQMAIYSMPESYPNVRAVELAKGKASKMGYNPDGQELVESVYLFQKDSNPSTLNLNIITNNFSISYDLNSNPAAIAGTPPKADEAIAIAKANISMGGFDMADITGPTSYEFLRVEGGSFIPVSSLSEAQITKVNLFRKNYNNVTAVTPHFTQANVWMMLGSRQGRSGNEIIAAEYHTFPLDEKIFGTYPLKEVQTAWEELKSGKGYIANFGENPSGVVGIRKIYLAYYDAGQYVKYFQPVFVFEGDNKFAAYVSAVSPDQYGQENPPQEENQNPDSQSQE